MTIRSSQSLTESLARYIANARTADIPQATLKKAKLHILDTLGAIISGYGLNAGNATLKYVSNETGPPDASLLISGRRVPAPTAAFANAMAAHADETDDAHPASITHPGCAIVPAALAACEHYGRSGLDLVGAVVLGYDFCARTGMALGAGRFLTEKSFDPHAFGGTIGSAAACSMLAHLDWQAAGWALSYAVQQTSGVGTVFRDKDHIEKAFVFAGKPARDGLVSVQLVASGFTGVDDALDGEWNFWAAFGASDPSQFFETLGARYEVEHTNIKRWSVGSPIQAALDSVDALHRERQLVPEAIDSIEVKLPVEGARVVDNRSMPNVNLQHQVALMIIDGGLGFLSSHDATRMEDPRVLALRSKITLVPDEMLSRAEPSRQAIVEVTFNDGTMRRHHTKNVRGTTGNPMTWDEVAAKARDLMVPTLGPAQTEAVISTVNSLDRLQSIHELIAALSRKRQA